MFILCEAEIRVYSRSWYRMHNMQQKKMNAFWSLVCFVESLVSLNKSRIESISKNWKWRFEIVNLLISNQQLTCENKSENVESMSRKSWVSSVKRTRFMKLSYMCSQTLSHHCKWSLICRFFSNRNYNCSFAVSTNRWQLFLCVCVFWIWNLYNNWSIWILELSIQNVFLWLFLSFFVRRFSSLSRLVWFV